MVVVAEAAEEFVLVPDCMMGRVRDAILSAERDIGVERERQNEGVIVKKQEKKEREKEKIRSDIFFFLF